MRTSKNLLKGLVCAIAAAAAINTAQAQLVAYDNSSDPVLGRFSPADNSLEFGDQVNLAGDANVVTEFRLEYYSSEAAGTGIVRFHANDGANGAPGTTLFQSGAFDLAADFNTVEVTGISVPLGSDFFTFTIEFNDLQNTQANGCACFCKYCKAAPAAATSDEIRGISRQGADRYDLAVQQQERLIHTAQHAGPPIHTLRRR
jgi:hypothetical protein